MAVHYVYRFIDINSNIMYVGETNNIDRRIREHLSCNSNRTCFKRSDLKLISRIEYLTLNSTEEGKLVEKYYIRKYLSPVLKNKAIPRQRIKMKNPPENWRTYKVFNKNKLIKKHSNVRLQFIVWLLRLLFWFIIFQLILK